MYFMCMHMHNLIAIKEQVTNWEEGTQRLGK